MEIVVRAVVLFGFLWLVTRWRRLRPVVHGVPVMIMKAGEPLLDVMTRERLSAPDLMASAREKGIRRLTDVDLAVLETDGKISFFTNTETDRGAPEKPSVG